VSAQDLADRIIHLMQRPTRRDGQVAIGPSAIGDPCDRCLGMAMGEKLHPRTSGSKFNLLAWSGTATHNQLETAVNAENWEGVSTEIRVGIGKVKGYGKVSGSIDIYSEEDATVTDYKVRYKSYIRLHRAKGKPEEKMLTQVQTYGYGVELSGKPIEEVCLFVIPRDSMDVRDIWVYTEKYDRAVALAAIKRAEKIWKNFVVPGKVDLLTSYRHCYNCSWGRDNTDFVEMD
jgi:hypothetical protein